MKLKDITQRQMLAIALAMVGVLLLGSFVAARVLTMVILGRVAQSVTVPPTFVQTPSGPMPKGLADQAPPPSNDAEFGGQQAPSAPANTGTGPADLYLYNLTVSGSSAQTGTTGFDLRVGSVDSLAVKVMVGNAGGAQSIRRSVQFTLYTPKEPSGRRVTQPLDIVGGGSSVESSADFDGLSDLSGQRVSLWIAIMPGDGGQTDQLRQGVVLAP